MNFAQYYQHYGPMMDGQHGGSWVGGLFSLLFLVIVVGAVVYAIRVFARSGHHFGAPAHREPLDIARERYAKGEITKEELAQIKKELQ